MKSAGQAWIEQLIGYLRVGNLHGIFEDDQADALADYIEDIQIKYDQAQVDLARKEAALDRAAEFIALRHDCPTANNFLCPQNPGKIGCDWGWTIKSKACWRLAFEAE